LQFLQAALSAAGLPTFFDERRQPLVLSHLARRPT